MKPIPLPLSFQWDQGNTDKNLIKHGVTTQEAESMFIDKPVLFFDDPKHSITESRYTAWGYADNHRLLVATFYNPRFSA